MRDMFDGAPGVAASVGNNAGLHDLEEEDEDEYLAWNYPQAVRTTTRDWTPANGEDAVDAENPWDGYDEPRLQEPPTKVNITGGEEWKCPLHGPTCNPGICTERARVEALRRKEKRHEEIQETKRKNAERREKNAEKKNRKLAQGREVSYDLPPHRARNRGAGGSGSDSEDSMSQLSGASMGIERTNTWLD